MITTIYSEENTIFDVMRDVQLADEGKKNVLLYDTIFENHDAAAKFLSEIEVNGDTSVVVRFIDEPEEVNSEKLANLEAKIADTAGKIDKAENGSYFKNYRAGFVTCKGCGSHINKTKIATHICPCCGADMRPDSEFAKIESYNRSLLALKERAEKERTYLVRSLTSTKWLVRTN